jgi:hypothetical protein
VVRPLARLALPAPLHSAAHHVHLVQRDPSAQLHSQLALVVLPALMPIPMAPCVCRAATVSSAAATPLRARGAPSARSQSMAMAGAPTGMLCIGLNSTFLI